MNREIKFRGRDTFKSDYFPAKWYYGGIMIDENDAWLCVKTEKKGVVSVRVEPKTVGQYTGLKDARGNEIYEGDMLECPNVPTIPLEVYYNPAKGSFCLAEHTHTEEVLNGTAPIGEMLMYYPNMHIIGNIHDNPELLNP